MEPMETSLHRELKYLHARDSLSVEVPLHGYRIDALDSDGRLVEIQHAALSGITKKVAELLGAGERVRVIKPILQSKSIETLDRRGGKLLRRRKSPKREHPVDVFKELIHFTSVYPHPRLSLELIHVDAVEVRIDRRERRWKRKAYDMVDQRLAGVGDRVLLSTAGDLWRLLGGPQLPKPFDTAMLAQAIEQPRWFSQQIAYTLRRCGAIEQLGKRGNNLLYCMVSSGADGAPKGRVRRKSA